jgi:hypothetical protein
MAAAPLKPVLSRYSQTSARLNPEQRVEGPLSPHPRHQLRLLVGVHRSGPGRFPEADSAEFW